MKTQRRSRRLAIALPDDVVMEILSRMPALDVLKCRWVCRRWRDLISTQHFQEMHLKSKACHSSMILFNKFVPIEEKGALLLLDKWEKPRKRPTIWKSRPNFIHYSGSGSIEFHISYDGLIVTKSSEREDDLCVFTVFNPISRDEVRIETPNPRFDVYGMFFNPLIKEYCILFVKYGPVDFQMGRPVEFQFLVLNLGAQPCCRTLKQSVSFLPNYGIFSREPPVVIDDHATIYWTVEGPSCEELILSFDIKTENFTFIPHPQPIHNCQGLKHKDMYIMEIDRRLSFVQSTIANERTSHIINIWTLKDFATQLWTKTYSVSIDISLDISRLWKFSQFMVIAVGNEELLLKYSHVRVYNLQLGTLRGIGKAHLGFLSNFSVFVPSFVSLRNCKPIIRI